MSINGLFIFRRDLRIEDNIGLLHASGICDNLYTCFIFTPEQIGKFNPYKSNNAVEFMIDSLSELSDSISNKDGNLMTFYGKNGKIISKLISQLDIHHIFFNMDYTPYAMERDSEIAELCKRLGVKCSMYQDYYLHQPGSIKNVTGGFYKKFTPFYTKIIDNDVLKPRYIRKYVFKKSSIEQTPLQKIKNMFVKKNPELIVKGGRKNGLKKLYETVKNQKHYSETRNQLAINTSLLSAYIKFGCVSIREVYHFFHKHFGKNSELLRQLIWREFYAHVLYGFPELLDKRVNNPIKWPNNESYLDAWIKGNTGFPVVDACMRQLNSTGWMHNRGRLIASCFLVKTLLVDWRYGEQYFAKKLVDYDVANNNGNWQWISGTGADTMPYFRTFSPWIQSKNYDVSAEYIKKWVPELNGVSANDIHDWNNSYKNPEYSMIKYPKPIVDFGEQRIKSLVLYKKYL